MISKSYLIEQDKDFLIKNKSVLFYGENLGLKNDFKRSVLEIFKGKVIKRGLRALVDKFLSRITLNIKVKIAGAQSGLWTSTCAGVSAIIKQIEKKSKKFFLLKLANVKLIRTAENR